MIFSKRRAASVLGLALDGNRLDAVALRRSGSTLHLQQSFTATLALSPLTGDPELVGREIRNQLDQAGVRQRQCCVCLPASWILTMQVRLPDLPEADVPGFLQLEAERGFPSGHESLHIVHSRSKAANGEQFATLMAVPRAHLATLEKAFKAAQLKPVTFSLGAAAIGSADADAAHGVITLSLGSEAVELQVASGGGIMALRSLDAAVETQGSQKRINADLVAREIRITIGQLPAAVGEGIRKVRVFGRGDAAREFVKEISPRLEAMGLKLELMDRASAAQFQQAPPAEIALSPALALAANYVMGADSGPEFLPPKVSPWKQMVGGKFSSKKLVWAGAAAGAAALLVIGAFVAQAIQIASWQAKYDSIKSQVEEVKKAKQQINTYRPWFDTTFSELRLMREVTKAFPESGPLMTARSFELRQDHDENAVTCTGVVRDNQNYLLTISKLQRAPGITNVSSDSLVNAANGVIQFSFKFNWTGE
jgi:hypothetical protein